MKNLTHLDNRGKARMVDVGDKPRSRREAVASASVRMKKETLKLIREGRMPKGDVLAAARIAGILAAKKTPGLIPLCHPINLTSVSVDLTPRPGRNLVEITTRVSALDHTGAEMEALLAAAVAALTVYDMCKAVDREMVLSDIKLIEKKGGKSGHFKRKVR